MLDIMLSKSTFFPHLHTDKPVRYSKRTFDTQRRVEHLQDLLDTMCEMVHLCICPSLFSPKYCILGRSRHITPARVTGAGCPVGRPGIATGYVAVAPGQFYE
ncbi:hypothetical protein J6590_075236 [Homalodisca vitripennis]|nr:hypothetical protein J6590_075236 [Homalodisca vitripennis]